MGLEDKVAVLGVGKTAYHNAIGAITAGSVCPFSEDDSNSAHPTWAEWGNNGSRAPSDCMHKHYLYQIQCAYDL